MDVSNKRLKTLSPAFGAQDDFIPFGKDHDVQNHQQRRPHMHDINRSRDRRNVEDKPHSKHVLAGYEPWVLIKTKFHRRFVHNTETKESFWRIPQNVIAGVVAFDRLEQDQKEKDENARWAEQQLEKMRHGSKAKEVNKAADDEGRSRRRRSESLQREDEAAMMAELAAQAEHAEEQDVKDTLRAIDQGQSSKIAYDSEGSYDEIEVTDSEFEDEEGTADSAGKQANGPGQDTDQENDLVEFGEDDIAYQLAAMENDFVENDGDDDGANGSQSDYDEGLPLTEADAANLFRDLLDDHQISPFTPWDTVIADESDTSILHDDRYTVVPNMRLRREIFDAWVRDRAAQIQAERKTMEKQDPRVSYLAFLQDKATTKLYWPEFKRKYKREPELNDRKLSDRDREKLYRDHIARLKLPETTRKADLLTLMKGMPHELLNKTTRVDALPQQVLSHLHYVSLAPVERDRVVQSYIRSLAT